MAIEFFIAGRIAYPADGRGDACEYVQNGSSSRKVSNFEELFFGDVEKNLLIPCWQTCIKKCCPARRRAACAYIHLVAIIKLPWKKERNGNGF